MTDDWIVDDENIPDGAFAHRRLTQPGDTVIDMESGALTIGASAYAYKSDGMSVYVSTAMEVEGVSDGDLIDWERERLARVTAKTVRRENQGQEFQSKHPPIGTVLAGQKLEPRGGITLKAAADYPDDERVRRSHGLIRVAEAPPARTIWNAFRNKLIQGSEMKGAKDAPWVDATGSVSPIETGAQDAPGDMAGGPPVTT